MLPLFCSSDTNKRNTNNRTNIVTEVEGNQVNEFLTHSLSTIPWGDGRSERTETGHSDRYAEWMQG